MDTLSGRRSDRHVNYIQTLPQRPCTPEFQDSPATSPKHLPSARSRYHRNREIQSSASDSLHNSPEHNQAIDTLESYWYGVVEESGNNGTGFSGTVQPGTAEVPCSPTMQLPQTRGHSPPSASRQISMKGAFETRGSRSESRVRRASIGSIKEDITDIPQSFLDRSRKSPPSPPSPDRNHTGSKDTLHTLSATPNFYCPAGAFQGWKQVKLAGKKQSKSSTDLTRLTSLRDEWLWDSDIKQNIRKMDTQASRFRTVGIEDMPFEILDMILSYLMQDLSPDSYGPRNKDLMACLMTSRLIHAATLSVLYKHVTIPFSITFSKMLNHIEEHPGLGTLVRRLDFSHYTSVGFGRTRRDSWEIQNVTPKTLLRCLELFTNLKEFEVHEHIDDELDEDVLKKLFSMPSLHAMDFCASSSRRFVSGFTNAITMNEMLPASLSNLKRLGLHACTTLQAPVFEALLPRLPRLTHLDVGMTLITDKALMSIPRSAHITHLGLGKCTRITGAKVVEFLTTHEAVKNSLVYLNVMADMSRYMLLSDDDLVKLLPRLPSTMRTLNIGGAQVSNKHVPLLLPLTKHLEELGLSSANLTANELNSLFIPAPPGDDEDSDISEDELNWEPCALRYLDLTSVSSISHSTLFSSSCVLASPHSYPLEVIELGDPIVQQLKVRASTIKRIGWTIKELGRRGWFVRLPSGDHCDDGRRSWKMGARWWGMRKVPVAVQEVGGMYGHYMFKS